LVDDLDAQRRAIVEHIARVDPHEALDLIWRFLGVASTVFERVDDSSGTVADIFHAGCRDLGRIAIQAKPNPLDLAERAFVALSENDYSQYNELIELLTPALGVDGREHLKVRVTELSQTSVNTPAAGDRKVIGWSSRGPIYADEIERSHREIVTRVALQQIADAQGDVDAFIAQHSERAKTMPQVAAEIAQRLLIAGRAEEAWAAINNVVEDRPRWMPYEWQKTRIDVMEALGRTQEALDYRWMCFEGSLSSEHLRAYLRRLPDFADFEAEQRAMEFAISYSDKIVALDFLISWLALDKAAALVIRSAGELDGGRYESLTPAAEALGEKHPFAATMILRAMIDFALRENRVKRYKHAARHLSECGRLAQAVGDFGAQMTHQAYYDRIKAEHGRKSSFWTFFS
jgi:hypothetical protein